jgi:hypothetical protein
MSFQTNPGILGHSRPRFFPSIFTPFRHTIPFDAVSSGILTVTSENIKIPQNCNVTTPQLIHSTSSPPPPPLFIRKHQHSAFRNWKSENNNRMNASEFLGYECIILFSFRFIVELCEWTSGNWVNIRVIRNVLDNELVRKMTILRKGNTRVLVSQWDGKS